MKTINALSLSAVPILLAGAVLSQAAPANAAFLNGVLQSTGALNLAINTRPGPSGGLTVLFDPEASDGLGLAPVDTYALFNIPNNNTGSFLIYDTLNNQPTPPGGNTLPYQGQVLSFDQLTNFAALPFVLLPAVSNPPDNSPAGASSILATQVFVNQASIVISPPIQDGPFVEFSFNATGFALNGGDRSETVFDFTVQGLGSALAPELVDFSFSGTVGFTFTPPVGVPEPSSLGAIVGMGILGGGLLLKRGRKPII